MIPIYLLSLFAAALASPIAGRASQVYHLQISAPGAPVHGKLIEQLVGISSVHTTFVLGYFGDSSSDSLSSTYNFTVEPSPVQAPPGLQPNHLLKASPDNGIDFLANLIGSSDGGDKWFMLFSTDNPPDDFATTSIQRWKRWKLLPGNPPKVVFGTMDDVGGWYLCRIGTFYPANHRNLVWIKDAFTANKPAEWNSCKAIDILAVKA